MKQWVINEPDDLFDVEDYGLVYFLTDSDIDYAGYEYHIHTKEGIQSFTWNELKNSTIAQDGDEFEIY